MVVELMLKVDHLSQSWLEGDGGADGLEQHALNGCSLLLLPEEKEKRRKMRKKSERVMMTTMHP